MYTSPKSTIVILGEGVNSATFIGREYELGRLGDLLSKKVASVAVVRGRRRIGKSRLIVEFARKMTFYQFSGLAPDKDITAQHQRDEFIIQLSEQTGLPEVKVDDWSKVFLLLADKVKSGRVILLFDEITWMAQGDSAFLSKLKNAWDLHFSKNRKLILILCGSVSAWIEKNIINSTGFIGRISLDLILHELPLFYCNRLLEVLGFHRSAREKIIAVSLTGCIPWYLEQMNPKFSAEDNIKKLCFEPNALMLNEFNRVFHDLFGKRGEIYKRIVKLLVTHTLDYSALADKLNYPRGSALTDYLDELECAGYIKKESAWSLKTGRISKLRKYRLSDNYLRFYFKYILPKTDAINNGQYLKISIDHLPGWKTVLGLQFENLVLNNRDLVIKALGINPEDIIRDGPYFQRPTARQQGCQIDYLIQTKLNTLFACEIKFSNKIIANEIINQMKAKIVKLALPRSFAVLPVLIHFDGNSDGLITQEYFYQCIDFSEFFLEQGSVF